MILEAFYNLSDSLILATFDVVSVLHRALLFFLYNFFPSFYVHYLEGTPLLVPSKLYN